MALPKINRLKHHQDFKQVYQTGRSYSSPHLAIRTVATTAQGGDSPPPPTQIGIAVSKKVSKKAVVRNRIKRQIRGAIRDILPKIPLGWKIIIVVRQRGIECKYEHFLRELRELLIKAEIINGY